ncbi:MAG: SAM-dependent methyltransferase, partial [Bacteroidales bacterium]|nr:SAM-dependent methyltransferase [Bacteroidales bacterium]
MMIPDTIQKYLDQLPIKDGVLLGSEKQPDPDFESNFLKVREAENRLYSDQEVMQLPWLKGHIHSKEWG